MLIGISGQAGSGKDTVADHLCRHHGFVKVGFADPMKRYVQDALDFSDEQIWGASEHRNAPDTRYPRGRTWDSRNGQELVEFLTPRYALQTIGTEWGRNCYPNIWVDYAIRIHARLQQGGCAYDQKRGLYSVCYIGEMMKPKTNVVISDVRFKNELEGIREAGGSLLRVIRPGADGAVGIAGHASEEEQKSFTDDMFDGVILNNSTLENLYATIDRAVLPCLRTGASHGG